MKESTVYGTIMAIDKDSSGIYSKNIAASTKEEFNEQVKEFESDVPFERWYGEVNIDDVITDEMKEIMSDCEDDYNIF